MSDASNVKNDNSNDNEAYIFEVSQQSFDASVITNSHKIPVLVEFMGIWSGPCIQMSDQLSGLATEFAGQFVFAKVDIDEQAELKEEHAIVNVPTLKVFKDGKVVRTEVGQLNEVELRAILKEFGVFSQINEMRMQAREKHMSGETVEAVKLLTQAIQQDPSNVNVAMDMAQIFIDMKELEQATALFNQLPDSAKTSDMGKSLTGQLTFLELAAKTAGKFQLQQTLLTSPDDCDAHFDMAICLIAESDYLQAADHLFEIMRINPNYKDDAAKEMIINVSNMLKQNDPELSSKIRGRLSSVSFS